MCNIAGIANIANNSAENQEKIAFVAQMMIYHMATYNTDGCGIAIGFKDGTSSYKKTAESGETWAGKLSLTDQKEYANIILHTRTATTGAVCDMNAHPFETSFGFLVENGWQHELFRKYIDKMKTSCDTEVLAYFFNPDPEIFNSFLEGPEHFCIAHLAEDGSNIQIFNKNKSQWMYHSDVISADIFCTSRNVLLEVCSILEENPDIQSVPNNTTVLFEDGNVTKEHFEFKDLPWRGGGMSYLEPYGAERRFYDAADYFEYNQQRAMEVQNIFKPKKLSRKEKKRAKKDKMYQDLFKNYIDKD